MSDRAPSNYTLVGEDQIRMEYDRAADIMKCKEDLYIALLYKGYVLPSEKSSVCTTNYLQ